jgi:hypothetical protein
VGPSVEGLWLIAELEGTMVSPVNDLGHPVDPTPKGFPIAVWREPTPVPAEAACLFNRWLGPRGVREATPAEVARFQAGTFVAPALPGRLSEALGRLAEIHVVALRHERGPDREKFILGPDPLIPLPEERGAVIRELERSLDAVCKAVEPPSELADRAMRQRALRVEAMKIGVPRRKLPKLVSGRPAARAPERRLEELVGAIRGLRGRRDDGGAAFDRLIRRSIGPALDPLRMRKLAVATVARMVYVVENDPSMFGHLEIGAPLQKTLQVLLHDRRSRRPT